MRSARWSVWRRVLVIAALSAVIGGVAVYQGSAIVGRSGDGAYVVGSGRAPVEPVVGSKFIRSYPARFNGQKTDFGHYTSGLKASEVIDEYARRVRAGGSADAPHATAPALRSAGSECSTFSYVTGGGEVVGIVAFDNPGAGGSEYFVGVMAAQKAEPRSGRDCPGREPPGVAKPPRSTRTLCIENMGGVPSVMAFYEAWGGPGEMIDDLRLAMSGNRWTERGGSSRILSANFAGEALLSFSRGSEQCLIAVDRESKSGKILLLVFWAERRWFPDGTAL